MCYPVRHESVASIATRRGSLLHRKLLQMLFWADVSTLGGKVLSSRLHRPGFSHLSTLCSAHREVSLYQSSHCMSELHEHDCLTCGLQDVPHNENCDVMQISHPRGLGSVRLRHEHECMFLYAVYMYGEVMKGISHLNSRPLDLQQLFA